MKGLLSRLTKRGRAAAAEGDNKLQPVLRAAAAAGLVVTDKSDSSFTAIPYIDLELPCDTAKAAAALVQSSGWKLVHPHQIAMFAVMKGQPDPFPAVGDRRIVIYTKGSNPEGGKLPSHDVMRRVRREIEEAGKRGPVRLMCLRGAMDTGVAVVNKIAAVAQGKEEAAA